MIRSDTDIITFLHDNEKEIERYLRLISNYTKLHKNISKIILIDRKSQDKTIKEAKKTLEKLQNPRIKLFIDKKGISISEIIENIIQELDANNVIFIEPELNTLCRNITKEIAWLQKVHILMPDRFHHKSLCTWKRGARACTHKENMTLRKRFQCEIRDPSNQNIACRANVLKKMIAKYDAKSHVFELFLKEGKNYRVCQPPVEYDQTRIR
jgi:hypothetical protein